MINHLRRQLDQKDAFLQAMNRTIQSVPGLASQIQLPPSSGAQPRMGQPPYEHPLASGGGQGRPEVTAQQINASPYFQNRIPLAAAHAGAEQAARGPSDAYGKGGPPMQPLSNGTSIYGGRSSGNGDAGVNGRYGHLADPHMQTSQPTSMGAMVSWEGNASGQLFTFPSQ